MIKQIADTNICIYLLDGRAPAREWWEKNFEETAITDVIKLELLAGGKTIDEKKNIDAFLEQIPMLVTGRADLVSVEECYRTWNFEKHPSATKLADLAIAKVAMAAGLAVATYDLKHFVKIDGLRAYKPFEI